MYIVLCWGENKNVLTLDIDDKKNTICIFASKGTYAAYLNSSLQ